MDIRGRFLGLQASAVSVTYSGGSDGMALRTYSVLPGACTVLSPGTALRCPTQPGVGANYTFVVAVDSGASDPSPTRLSYSPPILFGLDGRGASNGPTVGGSTVLLRGSNFGPSAGGGQVAARASPAADAALVFFAENCSVVEPHVTIQCDLPAGLGTALSWDVSVEGQGNTRPLSSYAPPAVRNASFAAPGTAFADTKGGTAFVLDGANFGPFVNRTRVTASVPAGEMEALNCTLLTPHTRLQCLLPPGAGAISQFTVTVLGQSVSWPVSGLVYAPPVVSSVAPAALGTDVSSQAVRVTGTGFGPLSGSAAGLVQVQLTAASPCGGTSLRLDGRSVVAASDDTLSFELQGGLSHVVPAWTLTVTVAGQSSVPFTLATRPPTVPTMTFENNFNGTHYFLLLTGSDYGPLLTACASDVTVRIDGTLCAELSMTLVSSACGAEILAPAAMVACTFAIA